MPWRARTESSLAKNDMIPSRSPFALVKFCCKRGDHRTEVIKAHPFVRQTQTSDRSTLGIHIASFYNSNYCTLYFLNYNNQSFGSVYSYLVCLWDGAYQNWTMTNRFVDVPVFLTPALGLQKPVVYLWSHWWDPTQSTSSTSDLSFSSKLSTLWEPNSTFLYVRGHSRMCILGFCHPFPYMSL